MATLSHSLSHVPPPSSPALLRLSSPPASHLHHHLTPLCIHSFSFPLPASRRGFLPHPAIFQFHPIPSPRPGDTGMATAASLSQSASEQMEPSVLRKILAAMVEPYLKKNPTAMAALDIIGGHDGGPICYDHFAFRTFGMDGHGIGSMAQLFLDLGYEAREELRFPAKKLRAVWFSPPKHILESKGEKVSGPLPRVFISELLVDQLSTEAQAVIKKYAQQGARGAMYAAITSILNCLPWQAPEFSGYQCLARESEYAAWTLVNGYALNHLTVSVHRLHTTAQKISRLNQLLQENGIRLNSEGGILKVSPDGLLQQSSTVADSMPFCFAGGEIKTVPASYIEFAERLPLPDYATLPADRIEEWHRRDGFEVGNADKIFESTSSDQTGVHAS